VFVFGFHGNRQSTASLTGHVRSSRDEPGGERPRPCERSSIC
jgi:hypothetical protein